MLIELAEQARQLLAQGERPDVLCATSMTNVPTFLALVRRELGSCRCCSTCTRTS